MGKISVFKFNITTKNSQHIIDTIMENYLQTNAFSFNTEENCYVKGYLSKKEGKKKNGNYDPICNCLKYEVINNQLIIKAYILNSLSNIRSYIQPSSNTIDVAYKYYNELKENVFILLKQSGVILVSEEKVTIKDGSGKKLLKSFIAFILTIIIIIAIVFTIINF